MRIVISLTLASQFVFLAGFNVWNMLTSRGTSPRGSRLWTQIHRVAGYTFIALFGVVCYFMVLRIKGWSDELSPRLILHMGLAFSLAPLLLVKVIVACYQKGARGLLTALGIGIFAAAFTLVSLNVSIHFLCAASSARVPVRTSLTFVFVVFVSTAIPLFARGKQTKSKSETGIFSLNKPASRELSNRSEPLNLILARIEPQTHDAKTLRFRMVDSTRGIFATRRCFWLARGAPWSSR